MRKFIPLWLTSTLMSLAATLLLLGIARWDVAAWAIDLPPYTHDFGDREVTAVAMTDGARLTTQIYTPAGEGPWPALLVRSPYNVYRSFETVCKLFTLYGYACVHQDVRGRFESEGEWTPLLNERGDGLDTIAWLNRQPWQNGQVALFGPSYLGAVQWLVADGLPPEVKTIIPTVFGTDLYTMAYRDGQFRHEMTTAWAAVMPDNQMRLDNGGAYQDAIRHRPAIEVDEKFFGQRIDWFREMQTSQGRDDPFWHRPEIVALRTMPERTDVPVLMIGAWYGFFSSSQLDIFARLKSRDRSRLVIGPWSHVHRDFGDLDLPNMRSLGAQIAIILDWLDHHLRGGELKQTPGMVEAYVIEDGEWRCRPSWPPATQMRRMHLAIDAGVPGCAGGALAEAPPTSLRRTSYRYDPEDPVPTAGGSGLLAFALPGFGGIEPGSVEQPPPCLRPDVLTFVGQPLSEPLHLAGTTRVRLTVSTDAPDTAFTAKLIRIDDDGEALNIRDGITSLAYRNGSGRRLRYQPGEPITIDITLDPIEWHLPVGTRLRLDISSSNFPAYHAHPNVAGPWVDQTEVHVATQTLVTGPRVEAFVELPVVTRAVGGR